MKDHMLANKLQSYSVESTNEMRKSVRASSTRYAVYLEEEKKMKVWKPKVLKKSFTEILRRFIVRLLRKVKPVKYWMKKQGNRRGKKKAWRDRSFMIERTIWSNRRKNFKELNKPIGLCW